MKVKKIMNRIVDNGKKEDMEALSDVFIDMLYDLKYSNKDWYESIKYKMYKMAYGYHISEELAHEWVSEMENKDGTTGEHWNYEQTEQVRKQYAPELNGCDFYTALNMVYSDFYTQKLTTEDYIHLAKDFLKDEDAPCDKLLRYYFFIVD